MGFVNDHATCYCNTGQYCKSDYGGEGEGGKNRTTIDYKICERSLTAILSHHRIKLTHAIRRGRAEHHARAKIDAAEGFGCLGSVTVFQNRCKVYAELKN